MTVFLYRPSLSLTSGAGQLIRMQAEGLRAAGERVRVACRRGGARFFLRSGLPARRLSPERLGRLAASRDHIVVDHGPDLPGADVVFVHNLMTEALRHLDRPDWREQAAREAAVLRALRPDAPIVANSELVRRGLAEHFRMHPSRISVLYPGFDTERFDVQRREGLRARARASLGIEEGAPLVGFVTSGDFDKRGLDIFVAAAERIAAARPDAGFLVVGSKALPHPINKKRSQSPFIKKGRQGPFSAGARFSVKAALSGSSGKAPTPFLEHRAKSRRPERWFAALDVFLYPARFEEFGMVVVEAMAMGVPVLTSRRVGAAECLPAEYAPWLIDEPDAAAFAERTLALLADVEARRELAAAGSDRAAGLGRERYVTETVALIRERAAEKRG